mgnify:CR=1 FL=1
MLPTILNTPISIYDSVKAHFIFASLDVTSIHPVEINIKLEPSLPIVYLSSAVDKKIFEQDLYVYSLHMEIADMVHSTAPRPYLDPTRFSVDQPLIDGKKYRRMMLEVGGGSCIGSITNYLKSESLLPPKN